MDLTYVGKSEGDYFDLFHFLADGDRPVLEVLVDLDDNIWIAPTVSLGGEAFSGTPQQTKGRAHRHEIVEGVEGVICLKAVAAYVIPRIATLMARVYCPTDSNDESETKA